MQVNTPEFKKKFRFEADPFFELLFSLSYASEGLSLDDPYLGNWEKARKWVEEASPVTRAGWGFAPVLDSLLEPRQSEPRTIPESFTKLKQMPARDFRYFFLLGILHEKPLCQRLADQEISLEEAVTRLSAKKREWVSYIGLYPFDSEDPKTEFLLKIIGKKANDSFWKDYLASLEDWGKDIFSKFWLAHESEYEKSAKRFQKLFQVLDFEELAQRGLIKIRVGVKGDALEALRGGYQVKCRDIDQIWCLPSVFNTSRIWSARERDNQPTAVIFPYLDETLFANAKTPVKKDTRWDPLIMCRALGDPTRFAMLSILSRSPKSAAALAQQLGLTRATLSHHVALLREAHILQDDPQLKTLVVNWESVGQLSSALLDKFKKPHGA